MNVLVKLEISVLENALILFYCYYGNVMVT